MPFPGLRSRPGTSASQKRPFSTYEPSTTKPDTASPHKRGNSLRRLSLHLSKPNGDSFSPLFTHEPEEVAPSPPAGTPEEEEAEQKAEEPEEKTDTASPTAMQPESSNALTRPSTDLPIEQEPLPRPQRFSLLRFKNASDPQLSFSFSKKAPELPQEPLPAPAIITTAPTAHNLDEPTKKNSMNKLFARAPSPFRKNAASRQSYVDDTDRNHGINNISGQVAASTPNLPQRPSTGTRQHSRLDTVTAAPPAYGDDTGSQLAIPVDRLSDSSRSDGSDNRLYAQTTTTHTISTTTTFFKLKRRKKNKGPLFPLPERVPPPSSGRTSLIEESI